MATAIKIENVSKQYRLGQVGTGTISHDLNRWWAKVRGKEDPYAKVGQVNKRDQAADSEYVWALRHINLEVDQGEVLGIIGTNGAGKSTLLKLISRITSPTSGMVKAKGRIASLLEVGTGMHPEMTARENIYLNGAILGMRRSEITKKLDDIIDFAGCRMFVDTPVKRFSSGMRVRVGFAVAAFLEPEILIVDEVLAVGDAEFQRQAIAKMQEISCTSGRTILFVSHNMAAIENLCNRVVVLREGAVSLNLPAHVAIQEYLTRDVQVSGEGCFNESTDRSGNGKARIVSAMLLNRDQETSSTFFCGSYFKIRLVYEVIAGHELDLDFGILFTSESGARITRVQSRISCSERLNGAKGRGVVECVLPKIMLVPGTYQISFATLSQDGQFLDNLDRVMAFTVVETDYFGTGRIPNSKGGCMLMDCDWAFPPTETALAQ